MKKILAGLVALACTGVIAQSVYQPTYMKDAYVTKNGTYVAPSVATKPNDTKLDNYSTKGNVNPYTGKEGTVDPYKVELPKLETYKSPKY